VARNTNSTTQLANSRRFLKRARLVNHHQNGGRRLRMKRIPEKRNREVKMEKHHILPASVGGSSKPKNIAFIVQKYHRLYHQLFGNLTPDEIIIILVETFWNNQWHWVEKALERRKND
jgi:hypothetical protein